MGRAYLTGEADRRAAGEPMREADFVGRTVRRGPTAKIRLPDGRWGERWTAPRVR